MSRIDTNKINDFDKIRAARTGDVKQPGKTETGAIENRAGVSEDKLQFSGRAAEAGKLLEEMKSLPDIREEKVSELREQVTADSYRPTGEEIADAILKDENQS